MTTTTDTRISEAMAAAVGTELSRRISYPVSSSDIRRWALAVYFPEPPPAEYFVDPEAPEGHPAHREGGRLIAPHEFNPFAWATAETTTRGSVEGAGADRHEARAGIAGPGLKKQLNGGMKVEYGVPIRPGDIITSVTRMGPYSEREGRLGLMLFSSTEDIWTNQRGEQVKRTTNTLIRY